MNVFAHHDAHPTLVIGIGNPLRSDDGLGWAVAEQLSQESNPGCVIRTVHQLTPDLALWMEAASRVILIDANREGVPGELHVRSVPSLSPRTQPGAVGTHHTTPEELGALTAAVYGHCPPIVVVTMTGANFGIGEQLSPIVAQRIPLASAAVRQACTNDL